MSFTQEIMMYFFIIPTFIFLIFATIDNIWSYYSRKFCNQQLKRSREEREKLEEIKFKAELRKMRGV